MNIHPHLNSAFLNEIFRACHEKMEKKNLKKHKILIVRHFSIIHFTFSTRLYIHYFLTTIVSKEV